MDDISDKELRDKLLKFGIDVPVAANKEFLTKKLQKLEAEAKGRRKSTSSVVRSRPPPDGPGSGSASKRSRMSLNVNASVNEAGRAAAPAPAPLVRVPPPTNSNSNRLNHLNHQNGEEMEDIEEEMSDSELREKLLAYGIDVPTAANKEFLTRKLHALEAKEQEVKAATLRRRSTPPVRPTPPPEVPSPVPGNSTSKRSRMSVNNPPLTLNESLDVGVGGCGDPPSPRYQAYLDYFKRPLSDQPLPQLVLPRSQYASPSGSPVSNVATAGSPYRTSFNDSMEDDDDTAEDDEEERTPHSRKLGKGKGSFSVNPVNWIPKGWFSSTVKREGQYQPGPDRQTDGSYSLGIASGSGSGGGGGGMRFPPSPPSNSARHSSSSSSSQGVNGHWGSTSSRSSARLANQIYSPAQPSPPAVAAGRQAGFKAFFSRGERNGYGYSSGGPGTTDSSHLISKCLIIFVVLMFASIGIYYAYKVNMIPSALDGEKTISSFFDGFLGAKEGEKAIATPEIKASLVYPQCGEEGYDPDACVMKAQIKNSKILFDALKVELVDRAKMKGCGSDVEDKITLASAKNLLFGLVELSKSDVESAFEGMLMLVTENPTRGVKIEGEYSDDVSIKDVRSLDFDTAKIHVPGVSANFVCVVFSGLFALMWYCLNFAALSGVGYGGYKILTYYRGRKEREEREMFDYVEEILKLLHEQYEASKNSGDDPFLAQNHVRDVLFPARDRKKKEALWNKIVLHISSNESRVREEIQHLSGEEFRVWRWLPSASPLMTSKLLQHSPSSADSFLSSPSSSQQGAGALGSGLYPNLSDMDSDTSMMGNSFNSKWQGQAFEMTEGSPNSLPLIPTTCLKIRQMYDNDKDSGEAIESKIERAIVEKCSQSNILHIGIDHDSRCVYVRCQTKEDAHLAYKSLHGWWFDGNLLSVRFLREDRYFARFPQAKHRSVPLKTANLSSPGVQFSGQQSFSNSGRKY